MATMKKTRKRGRGHDEKAEVKPEELAEMRRQQRVEALKLIAGIWADREDIPADALEYLRQLRSE